MNDLSKSFYDFLKSGNYAPVELPKVGTLAEFEAVLSELDSLSDSQCREMLKEAMKLVMAQQKLLESVMKPKF